MNRQMITYALGKFLKIYGLLLCAPILVSVIYQESCGLFYGLTGLGVFTLGHWISRKPPKITSIYAKEGFVIVAVSWILASFFGAIPFYVSDQIPSFVDAFFEMVSGFTTTGCSILDDVEILSYTTLFWRSFSHWIGGMGILVFVIAFLPISTGRSMHILKAEMPGPVVGKLVSKVQLTARILYIMYATLTVIEILLLLFGGMPVFDSVVNALSTAGTGGFTIKNASIASYQSAYTENVITVFMILFGINFNLMYFILIGKVTTALRSEELRWYLGIIIGAIAAITLNISYLYSSVFEAFRYASFQVASIITTTGYATTDYTLWPMFSHCILMLLMFIGGSSGSTSGGMKVSRVVMYIKNAGAELKRMLHPHSVVSAEFEKQPITPNIMKNLHSYLVLYIFIFIGTVFVLSFEQLDFESIFSAVASCLNNIGAGLGTFGPGNSFGGLSSLSKIALSFVMLVGRLEIFPMLLLFSPRLWRKS